MKKHRYIFRNLGITHYEDTLDLQIEILERKLKNRDEPEYFLLTEHHHVFTLGKGGKEENLVVPPILESGEKIPLIRIDRGGDITYHGPGQLVVYPIFDLKKTGVSISEFLFLLEESVIQLLSEYELEGERSQINRGIFVKGKKIAFIGMAMKDRITYHGMSINICPELRYFSFINPCGIANLPVTSLAEEARLLEISVPDILPLFVEKMTALLEELFIPR